MSPHSFNSFQFSARCLGANGLGGIPLHQLDRRGWSRAGHGDAAARFEAVPSAKSPWLRKVVLPLAAIVAIAAAAIKPATAAAPPYSVGATVPARWVIVLLPPPPGPVRPVR